ncbi:unnamed protein product [Medioppia subpectinata]|uniref:GDT1 family protein n=1 Tax=Medioppia subpectinata TaxID=1979941 RepID=A0A7R9KLS2_9ACAR|nr:unnamed protein product [Medioppia subpectinata]CAG2105932.1 unnamed protein product [Medioppia subpectinata]
MRMQTNSKATYLMVVLICVFLSQYMGSFTPLYDTTKHLWSLLIESRFTQALIASFIVIIFSELGDKTFFISAIMAMKNSRSPVFFGSMTANVVMNGISVLLGIVTQVIPKTFINYLSIILFTFFGFRMIYESYTTSDTTQEELEEAENELKKLDSKEKSDYSSIIWKYLPFLSLVFIETFCLIFFAEWGDKSQISTIVLAAREDPIGVIVGSIFGYSVCTAIAVLGGSILAQIISIKTVTLIGGISFLAFAGLALVLGIVRLKEAIDRQTIESLETELIGEESHEFEEWINTITAVAITGRVYNRANRQFKRVATDWEPFLTMEGTPVFSTTPTTTLHILLESMDAFKRLMSGQVIAHFTPTVGYVCLVFGDSLLEDHSFDGFEVIDCCHRLQHHLDANECQDKKCVQIVSREDTDVKHWSPSEV